MASKKPCPGCGEARTQRKSNDICYRCKELIQAGKAYEAMTTNTTGKEWLKMPDRHYWLPHCYSDAFQQAFFELVQAIGEDSGAYIPSALPPHHDLPLHYTSGYDRCYAVPIGTHAAFCKMWDAVFDLFKERHNDGRQEGRNLLRGLACGEISTSDFYDRVSRM